METKWMQDQIMKFEEEYDEETDEEHLILKKKIETENEVETLKDLIDNSRMQYNDFHRASEEHLRKIEIDTSNL